MRTKKALLALSTAIVLLAAGSLAQAKEHRHGKVVAQPRNAYGLIAPSQNRDTTPQVRPTGPGNPPSLDFAPSRDFMSTLNNGG
jgi:hypothetical protein